MEPINTNRDRLAAAHHRDREPGSRITIRRRGHKPVSPAVQPTVSAEQQAKVQWLGSRGLISLQVAGGPSSVTSAAIQRGAGWSGSERYNPQARLPRPALLAQRDRRSIPGAGHPSGHPAIGRPVISPNIIPYQGP